MNTSDTITELATALAKAQAAMRPATKDSTNPAFRSKYADLSAVWEAVRKPLGDNGLVVLQDVTLGEHGVSVTTRLVHVSGQWVEFGPLTVPLTKRDAQGVGSATSYGRRYALLAALGIVAEEDDDGNAASAPSPPPSVTRKVTVAPKATPAPTPASASVTPEALRAMAHKAGVPTATICAHYSVETLEDLSAEQVQDAAARLAKKGAA